MPVVLLTCDHHKCLQALPKVPLGVKSPGWEPRMWKSHMWTMTLFSWLFCPRLLWFPFCLSELFLLSLLCPPSDFGVHKSIVSIHFSLYRFSMMALPSPVTPETIVVLRNSKTWSAYHSPEPQTMCIFTNQICALITHPPTPFLGLCLAMWHHIRDLGVILDFDLSLSPIPGNSVSSFHSTPSTSCLSHNWCPGHIFSYFIAAPS